VVLANIGWSTIIDMAPDLVARTAPGGWLAVSGISPAQVSRVAAALRPLPVTARPHDGEWAAVVCSAQQNGSGESPNGADHD
jgi:ribosomal protein L11 methylase PrmA